MTYLEEIGKIERTFLGVEDHGILTGQLFFTFGSSAQGTPAYFFDDANPSGNYSDPRVGLPRCAEWVRGVLEACGVDEWSQLKGKVMIVLRDSQDRYGPIVGIKPLPFERGKEYRWS